LISTKNSPSLEPESEIEKSAKVDKNENNSHAQNKMFDRSRCINKLKIEKINIESIPPVNIPSM
jgi:hypothetical protein